jgi:hypothetical protein
MTAGLLCVLAAGLCLLIPRRGHADAHDIGEPVTDSM